MTSSVGLLKAALIIDSAFSRAKAKVISEALGHSSVAFKMDLYSHIIEGMQQYAMILLDGVLPKAKNGVSGKNNAKLTPPLDIKPIKG